MATIDDRADVATVIADAYRVQRIVDEDPVAAVRRALRSANASVVLDTCENAVDRLRPVVDEDRPGVPRPPVLAASREPLGVAEECLREVRPLPVPTPRRRFDRDLTTCRRCACSWTGGIE